MTIDTRIRDERIDALNLPEGPFGFIMADPPWRFMSNSLAKPGKNAIGKYACMSLDEIKAMPIREVAAPDCLLWLWATNPMVPQALDVMSAWGFRFSTMGHWVKRTKHGKLAFGTGFRLRGAGEPFIIATIGRPKTTRGVRSVIEGALRAHSQKPEEAYAAAEAMMPGARRLDLFSRTDRDDWTAWGNETGKLNPELP